MRTPEEDKRNNDIINDPDYACYVFRGYVVLQFNKAVAKSDYRYELLHFGPDANLCNFIPEDLTLMAEFLFRCKLYADGLIEDVETVHVN